METNKFIGLGILVMFVMFLVPAVSAAVAEVTPEASTNYTGSVVMNCSYVNVTDITDPTSTDSFFYTNRTGSWAAETVTGFNHDATNFWATLTLTSSMDASGIAFNCTAGNATDTLASGAPLEGITFDSSDPSITLDVKFSGDSQTYNTPLSYKCGTSDGIDSSPTDTLTVTHPSGDTVSSTTLTAGSSDFLSFTDTNYAGDYLFTCSSTDYTGNVGSSTATVTIDALGKVISVTKNGASGFAENKWLWIIIGALALYYFTKKK